MCVYVCTRRIPYFHRFIPCLFSTLVPNTLQQGRLSANLKFFKATYMHLFKTVRVHVTLLMGRHPLPLPCGSLHVFSYTVSIKTSPCSLLFELNCFGLEKVGILIFSLNESQFYWDVCCFQKPRSTKTDRTEHVPCPTKIHINVPLKTLAILHP